MAFSRRSFSHILSAALLACVALVPVGCGGGEGVNSYNVPKTTDTGRGGLPAAGSEYRILGGMFPADDPEWFFKLAGPADALNPYDAGFEQLLASVALQPGGAPPDFTPPEGWKRGPGRGQFVAATIRTPDDKYEVTVTSSRGGVWENLRRWSEDQLGTAFGAADTPKFTKPIEAKGVKGLKADLRGPNNPAAKGGPFMRGK